MYGSSGARITACIPYFRCRRYLRLAVDSLLAQTHRNITVVVVNDGDPEAPWDLLRDITDPRLVRFNLLANHGPYFANAVVLNATSAPYFLMQDADDWSSSTRAAELLAGIERDGSDLAVSAQPQYVQTAQGNRIVDMRWASVANRETQRGYVVRPVLTPAYAYRAPHAGLFRSDAIRRLGGYYGGFRLSYDTLLTNLILMTGSVSHVPRPLYYRLVRQESMSHCSATGTRSAHARQVNQAIRAIYRRCYTYYSAYLAGRIDSRQLSGSIRAQVLRNVTPPDARWLAIESERLRRALVSRHLEDDRRSHRQRHLTGVRA
jgi:glycosyltransferase involved in cell wall biosynthesis